MSMSNYGNQIIRTMAILSEHFSVLDITEDGELSASKIEYFIHLFEDVEDPRMKGKIVYTLPNLLLLIFIAILVGKRTSFTSIANFIVVKKNMLIDLGIVKKDQYPSHDTIRRILTIISNDSLYENTLQGIYNLLKSLENNVKITGDHKHIGVDGKEMRGSGRAAGCQKPLRNVSMLNIYDSSCMTTITSVPIDEKDNEIPVAQDLLKKMELKKNVITADALHCQRDTAKIIHKNKGIYVLAVKDNQKLLHKEIKAKFDRYEKESPDKIKAFEDDDKRTIHIIDLSKTNGLRDEWAGIKCFARLTSKRGRSKSTFYFITNTYDHHLIVEGISSRWLIENDLHQFKDVFLNEDVWRSTNRQALRNIALLNNLITQMFNIYRSLNGNKELAISKLEFELEPINCIEFVLATLSSEEVIDKLATALEKTAKKRAK